jgi:hypothetical protein
MVGVQCASGVQLQISDLPVDMRPSVACAMNKIGLVQKQDVGNNTMFFEGPLEGQNEIVSTLVEVGVPIPGLGDGPEEPDPNLAIY